MVCNSKKNLILDACGDRWLTWIADKGIEPSFSKVIINGQTRLEIKAKENQRNNYGKWIYTIDGIIGGSYYKCSVEYLMKNVENENVCIAQILTWLDSNGVVVARDYVDNITETEDGWRNLSRIINAPDNAYSVKMELVMKWTCSGSVLWRNASIFEVEPVPHRKVIAATTFFEPKHDLDKNFKAILDVLDKAGKHNPDIICLSETMYSLEIDLPIEKKADTIPGRLTDAVCEKAKKYNSYILLGMVEKEDRYYYNAAVLINRQGNIVGKYRKVHLAMFEAEEGISPGNEFPVFETDFGKIGIMICWDNWFPETARILRLKGAEVLFLQTAGTTPVQSKARAIDNGVHVVVSGAHNLSYIINPEGDIIADVTSEDEGVAVAEIDLDKRYYTYWLSVGPAYGEAHSIYLKERRPDTYHHLLK